MTVSGRRQRNGGLTLTSPTQPGADPRGRGRWSQGYHAQSRVRPCESADGSVTCTPLGGAPVGRLGGPFLTLSCLGLPCTPSWPHEDACLRPAQGGGGSFCVNSSMGWTWVVRHSAEGSGDGLSTVTVKFLSPEGPWTQAQHPPDHPRGPLLGRTHMPTVGLSAEQNSWVLPCKDLTSLGGEAGWEHGGSSAARTTTREGGGSALTSQGLTSAKMERGDQQRHK